MKRASRSPQTTQGPSVLRPKGLEAKSLTVGDDEYVLFSFPLPEWAIPQGLSDAEDWVARRLLEGQSAAEIARARKRSVATVRNQIRKIYGKLGVGSRAELVARCTSPRLGLTTSRGP